MNGSRGAFEAWAMRQYDKHDLPYFVMKDSDGNYADSNTEHAWVGWQASRQEVESEPFAYFTESGGKDCFTTDKQMGELGWPAIGSTFVTKLYTHSLLIGTDKQVGVPLEMACKIYNSGYQSGHHDTVEGGFTDVQYSDRGEHHSDEVQELLDELQEGE